MADQPIVTSGIGKVADVITVGEGNIGLAGHIANETAADCVIVLDVSIVVAVADHGFRTQLPNEAACVLTVGDDIGLVVTIIYGGMGSGANQAGGLSAAENDTALNS